MAQVRCAAIRAVGGEVVVVCSRDATRARCFAARNQVALSVDSVDALIALGLDAVVVEVPHDVQDDIVERLLLADIHVLVGGPLSRTFARGEALVAIARSRGLVLETGYEARYSKVWEFARDWSTRTADVGIVAAVDAVALFNQPKGTWYASESRSGGVAVTHLSYCFLNPLRWLFGTPDVFGAI